MAQVGRYIVDQLTPYVGWRGVQGNEYKEMSYNVTASQTIRRGDILIKAAAANTVEQAIAAPAAGNVTLSGGNVSIVGVAVMDFTADANGVDQETGATQIRVMPIQYGELLLRIYNATASSAEPQDLTLGTAYQFGRYTDADSVSWYVLSTTTTNGELVYTGFDPYVAAGDNYGAVWCRVNVAEANITV